MRLYKKDVPEGAVFLGEDSIGHVPRGEKVKIRAGKAFDVVAERKQTMWRKIRKDLYETAWEIGIRNHKREAVTVLVREYVPGEWSIMDNSHPYEKETAHRIRFDVPVPAGGESTLTYSVQVKQ